MKHKLNWMLWSFAYRHSPKITLADLADQLDVSRVSKLARISIRQAEFIHPYPSLSEFNRSLIWLLDRVNAGSVCAYFRGSAEPQILYQWVQPDTSLRNVEDEVREFLSLCKRLSAAELRPEIDRTTSESIKLARSLSERTLLKIGDLIA